MILVTFMMCDEVAKLVTVGHCVIVEFRQGIEMTANIDLRHTKRRHEATNRPATRFCHDVISTR